MTLTLSLLLALAQRISAHADALSAAAARLAHPPRSLSPHPSNPTSLLPPGAPAAARAEQTALRDALTEAQILATDATEFVPELAVANNLFASVRWLCHFDIPGALPLDPGGPGGSYSSRSYADVAKHAGVPEHQLRSIARMAMLAGFLAEPSPDADALCHSRLSAAMAEQPQLLEWARFVTSSSAPMVSRMVEATERWGDDRAANHTAYAIAWDTDQTVFGHVAAHPELQASWASYMRATTQSEVMSLAHLVDAWRPGWERLQARRGVLVDVGGGAGHVSTALARAFPGLRAVVQDRREVIERAQRENAPGLRAEGLPLAFQPHDFFAPQPVRPSGWDRSDAGDVYLLRQILHDWGDEQAVLILRHLAAALEASGPHARLVIMDTILPPPGSVSRSDEARLRVRDLTMLQAHNAYERSMAQWERLLADAHPALRIRTTIQPFKSLMAVIEVAWDPSPPSA
ncbi:S-adenosyl-L-methionine-dependent methyltransferase [Stachybotrys elegans]|uniref:S-adenosyl-L-methionine-dependent methyltransferase n=1 Tax=Stachybotrys elegans TaxID=80388 RepID=A0A8K0SX46_9HYPO|nr:S-adenosyl-L-methionine-dependent methyltransferase [Stachybotrys elegans]